MYKRAAERPITFTTGVDSDVSGNDVRDYCTNDLKAYVHTRMRFRERYGIAFDNEVNKSLCALCRAQYTRYSLTVDQRGVCVCEVTAQDLPTYTDSRFYGIVRVAYDPISDNIRTALPREGVWNDRRPQVIPVRHSHDRKRHSRSIRQRQALSGKRDNRNH